MAKVAINGLGRIGRTVLKAVLDTPEFKLGAVNDLVPADNLAFLLKYDTVYGRYSGSMEPGDSGLVIDGESYPPYSEKNPAELPWKKHDLVKVMAWYDNEWGYTIQLIREARRIAKEKM